MKVRVLLVDDHVMMREGLRSIISGTTDVEVVGEASNGSQAVELAGRSVPHVVVMDVVMPGLNGIEATRRIVKSDPAVRVVALSAHTNSLLVRGMLRAGASAYVLKSRASEELLRAISEAMDGKKYLSPDIAGVVVDGYVTALPPERDHAFAILTDRERETLQLLAEGKTTKEAAGTMHVSAKTVETHRRNMMEKLNLHSVAELTKYAIREGITSVDG